MSLNIFMYTVNYAESHIIQTLKTSIHTPRHTNNTKLHFSNFTVSKHQTFNKSVFYSYSYGTINIACSQRHTIGRNSEDDDPAQKKSLLRNVFSKTNPLGTKIIVRKTETKTSSPKSQHHRVTILVGIMAPKQGTTLDCRDAAHMN